MTDTTTAAPLPAQGLFARALGVITSPGRTFEYITAVPKVAGILALIAVLTGVSQGAFLLSPVGQQAWLDAQAQNFERFTGQPMSEDQAARNEKMAPYIGYLTVAGSLPVVPLVLAIEAGLLYAVFAFVLAGTATFKQVLAVMGHSSVISVLGLIFQVAIQFARGTISMTGPANAAVLLPMLPETSWLAHFLGLVDFFRIWWVIALSIGLGVLYKRSSRNIAITLFALYGVIAAGIATFLSR